MPDTCGCAMPSPGLMSQRRCLGGPGRRGLSHSEVATLPLVPVCGAKLEAHPEFGREMTVKQRAVFAFKILLAGKALCAQLLSGRWLERELTGRYGFSARDRARDPPLMQLNRPPWHE